MSRCMLQRICTLNNWLTLVNKNLKSLKGIGQVQADSAKLTEIPEYFEICKRSVSRYLTNIYPVRDGMVQYNTIFQAIILIIFSSTIYHTPF